MARYIASRTGETLSEGLAAWKEGEESSWRAYEPSLEVRASPCALVLIIYRYSVHSQIRIALETSGIPDS